MNDFGGLPLTLRTDATLTTGAGHAMRLAALGAAWLTLGGKATAVGAIEIPFVAEHYRRLGIPIRSAGSLAGEVIVVDSYEPAIRRELAMATGLGVVVDDLAEEVPSEAAAIWNPNPFGTPALYPGFAGAFIGGRDAVPIRAGIPAWDPRRDEVVAVVGGGAAEEVRAALALVPGCAPNVGWALVTDRPLPGWRTIAPDEWWAAAAQATALVVAAGVTLWEAAASGIPVVALQTAENQRRGIEWARRAGAPAVIVGLGDRESTARAIAAAVPRARPLPSLRDGSVNVARRLAALVAERCR